jgi:3-deoxy-manno-octulosonate cytidylyltransferase (CMP-KDO synthetase)
LPQSPREKERSLEQMRALDNGMKIAVVKVDSVPLGVDTHADLERARNLLKDVA